MESKKDLITQQIWFVSDKNGDILMFLDEPIKNPTTRKWEGKQPYVNSKIYNEICILAQQAQMNFETSPECIEIQFKRKI